MIGYKYILTYIIRQFKNNDIKETIEDTLKCYIYDDEYLTEKLGESFIEKTLKLIDDKMCSDIRKEILENFEIIITNNFPDIKIGKLTIIQTNEILNIIFTATIESEVKSLLNNELRKPYFETELSESVIESIKEILKK